MKLVKAFMAMTTIAAMTTSCLNDDSYTSGFSVLQTRSSVIYANNLQDTLYLQSYGPWSMKQNSGGDWCQMGMLTGRANDLYAIPIKISGQFSGVNYTSEVAALGEEASSYSSEAKSYNAGRYEWMRSEYVGSYSA